MSYYIIARLETALEGNAPPGKFGNRFPALLGKIIQNFEDCKIHETHDFSWHFSCTLKTKTSPLFSLKIWQKPSSFYMHRRSCSKLRHSVGFTICLLTICDHLLISFRHIACTNDHLFWIKSGPTTDINTIMMISTSPHIYTYCMYMFTTSMYIYSTALYWTACMQHCIALHRTVLDLYSALNYTGLYTVMYCIYI
jgi:hypothetical protein